MDIGEMKFTVSDEGAIKKVTIQEIKPCVVAQNKIRVLLQLDSEIKDVIPILVSRYPPGRVNYIENKVILTLNVNDRLVTLYPSGKVSMNKTINKEDAIHVITAIVGDINECFNEYEKGETKIEGKNISQIGPLEIYNCLPKTNCEECGEATCMAFSIKLLSGDVKLNQCLPLAKTGEIDCFKEIMGIQLMQKLGWETQIR